MYTMTFATLSVLAWYFPILSFVWRPQTSVIVFCFLAFFLLLSSALPNSLVFWLQLFFFFFVCLTDFYLFSLTLMRLIKWFGIFWCLLLYAGGFFFRFSRACTLLLLASTVRNNVTNVRKKLILLLRTRVSKVESLYHNNRTRFSCIKLRMKVFFTFIETCGQCGW